MKIVVGCCWFFVCYFNYFFPLFTWPMFLFSIFSQHFNECARTGTFCISWFFLICYYRLSNFFFFRHYIIIGSDVCVCVATQLGIIVYSMQISFGFFFWFVLNSFSFVHQNKNFNTNHFQQFPLFVNYSFRN